MPRPHQLGTEPMMSDLVDARFFQWRYAHPAEGEDARAVWAAAWKAGSWDTLRQNAQLGLNLAQIIQRLEELARIYGDVEQDTRIEAELEQASAYWRQDDHA